MFRYKADRIPVGMILCLSLVDFYLYFTSESVAFLALYWLVFIIPKGKICAWNHHHQHLPTFTNKKLNRFLEFFYALHTGITTNLWVLHHVLGHHHNFLDQTKDESRWKRDNGTQMGELEYTLKVAATAYPRGYEVGKRYPRPRKDFIIHTSICAVALVALVAYNPINALLLFILPMVTGLILTAWATYGHHAGLDTDNEFEASHNNLNWFYNVTTGNLGYHTAHHHKQGVHWSLLPALHQSIAAKIPKRLIQNNWL